MFINNTEQYNYDNDIVSPEFTKFVEDYYLVHGIRINVSTLKKHISEYIEHGKLNRLSFLLDVYGIPKNMNVKERITYFQLLGNS